MEASYGEGDPENSALWTRAGRTRYFAIAGSRRYRDRPCQNAFERWLGGPNADLPGKEYLREKCPAAKGKDGEENTSNFLRTRPFGLADLTAPIAMHRDEPTAIAFFTSSACL